MLSNGIFCLILLFCKISLGDFCSAPFKKEADLCVYVETGNSYTWCSANKECSAKGGELINSHSSIKKLIDNKIPSANCKPDCHLWVGLTDLANERYRNQSGWQRVNTKDVFPTDLKVFSVKPGQNPTGKVGQNCLRRKPLDIGGLGDVPCTNLYGFVCEFKTSENLRMPSWKLTPFNQATYNKDYCFEDSTTNDINSCQVKATADKNTRSVLYNQKTKQCRLLQYVDAQVEAEVAKSADWKKFTLE